MRKKKIALLFWFIVLATAIGVGAKMLEGTEKKIYSKAQIEEYGMSISYPLAYEPIIEEITNKEYISQTITSSLVGNAKNEDLSLTLVEKVIHAKSSDSGLTLLVEAIKKEKTKKTLEEISKNYITMFRVFNENLEILESNIEEVEVDGNLAAKVTIYAVANDITKMPGMVSYLIPMEDREITIAFAGTREMLKENEKEINKIIKSVKFTELPVNNENVSGEISGDKINVNEIIENLNDESGNKSGE